MSNEERNPIEQAMGFVAQVQNQQFNAAKLTIEWIHNDHRFAVESLNPLAAFELMEKVKEVAEKRMGKDAKKENKPKARPANERN